MIYIRTPSDDVTLTAILILFSTWLLLLLLLLLACGLHNHTYIKPIARDVQLKIPASSHITTGYN